MHGRLRVSDNHPTRRTGRCFVLGFLESPSKGEALGDATEMVIEHVDVERLGQVVACPGTQSSTASGTTPQPVIRITSVAGESRRNW